MTASQKEIDDIVRRVLAKLSGGQEQSCTATDELVLHERVISANLLSERLQGARRLAHVPDAVITPAARDMLRQQDIAVRTYKTKKSVTGGTAMIGVVASNFAVAPVKDALDRAGIAVDFVEAVGLSEIIKTLGESIQNKNAVMITDQTAAAVCLANRDVNFRAVQAQDVPSMKQAATAVGANLLVIDPQGMSGAGLARVVKEFCVGGPYPCPEGLRSVLN